MDVLHGNIIIAEEVCRVYVAGAETDKI